MRASWSALHASFTRLLNRTSADAALREMRCDYSELSAFATIGALLEHQHGAAGDPTSRLGVVRALVDAAQSEQRYRSTAHILVIMALWPGLDAVFSRLTRGFPTARDDLPADILSRLGEAILTTDLDKVSAVTATLIRNLERDVRRFLIDVRVRSDASRPIEDPAIEAAMTDATALDQGETVVVADLLFGIGGEDVLLLERVFLLGETQEEAGRALRLSPSAARKRCQRALRKLRSDQKSFRALSHSVRPIGL